jgi:SAM-dependent methyltransferase
MVDRFELTRRAEATHFWFRGFRRFVAPAIETLAAGRGDLHIIDCGCGVGQNVRLLRPFGRVAAFDLDATAARMTRAAGFAVVCADATRAPFRSEAFDLATSFDVLQCVERDQAAVTEMARLLRPGGALLMTVAALDVLRGDHAESWHEVRRYTPGTARRLVEQAGLRVERVSFLFGTLLPLMLTVRLLQRLLRPYRELRPDTDIAVPAALVNATLTAVVTAEAMAARLISLPFGSSLLVVARKPHG